MDSTKRLKQQDDSNQSNAASKPQYETTQYSVLSDDSNNCDRSKEKVLQQLCNRFTKYDDLISQSKYRTIYRGIDNESGCEVAWSCYLTKGIGSSLE